MRKLNLFEHGRIRYAPGLAMLSVGIIFTTVAGLPEAAQGAPYQRPGATKIASLNSSQQQVKWEFPVGRGHMTCNYSCTNDLSLGGRFMAFESYASFDPRDDDQFNDIYVRDFQRKNTEIISVAPDGTKSSGACVEVSPNTSNVVTLGVGSSNPSISESGRYVAFQSCANNLVEEDQENVLDVFVHDRRAGRTELISRASDGTPAQCVLSSQCSLLGSRSQESISADGRFVAFVSEAPNLVEGDTNFAPDVFVRDRVNKTTERVSVATGGGQSSGALPVLGGAGIGNSDVSISRNGRFVAFSSIAGDLVENDIPNYRSVPDVFIHDRKKETTERVNLSSAGDPEMPTPYSVATKSLSLSADGRFVAFTSEWGGFIPRDQNDAYDVFVHDRSSGRTQRASVTKDGWEGEGWSNRFESLSLSGDGRQLAFLTTSGLDPSDDRHPCPYNTAPSCQASFREHDSDWAPEDVYVHDISTGATERMTVGIEYANDRCSHDDDDSENNERACGASHPTLDVTGRYVSFFSNDDRLTTDDLNKDDDFFLRDRGAPVGAGSGGKPQKVNPPPPDDRICITPDICIPPQGTLFRRSTNGLGETLTRQGANLYGASLAYRPQYDDLFIAIEIEYMPRVMPFSPIFYGLRFKVEGRSYEVRATSLNYGTFGLFDCTGPAACTKVTDLRGGYGTTGMRVVFSLPLGNIGLQDGGRMEDVEAFSAIGSPVSGAVKILDQIRLK